MVKIRLMRVGMKGSPSYRVVIAEASSPRDGRIIESIGWYDPLTNPSTIKIDGDKARHWLSVGAQPTERCQNLFNRFLKKFELQSAAEASTAPAPKAGQA